MKRLLCTCLLGLLCLSAPALAGTEVRLTTDAADPKHPEVPPQIEATVVNGEKTTLDKIQLTIGGATVKPTKQREYNEGRETVAIAFVVSGTETWVGTDELDLGSDQATSPGALKTVEQAIDKLQLAAIVPAGSKAMIVSYSSGAEVKLPMGDLKTLSGGALGAQKDYHGHVGNDLVQGVTLAQAELEKVTAARKLMIVIGDGNDTNLETSRAQLTELKKQANAQHIQIHGIVWRSYVTSPGTALTALVGNVKTVQSVDGIGAELDAISNKIADRYYLTFPGTGMPWDGKEHDVTVKIGESDADADPVLLPKWSAPKPTHIPWGLISLGTLAAAGGVLFAMLRKRHGENMVPVVAQPMAMVAPVAPVVEAPRVQMKTEMMNAGGDQGGMPIVGWLVPLSGPASYQTFKLRPGLTRIGTSPPSDIVVRDDFMSAAHCQITSSPQGYTLVDDGSTNGCYVNDKKVTREELYDNDIIKLGQTTLKFKSIN
ncbi:MAG TPA: FHA domain-containing protein [Kofleriaceae bacterium]